MVDWKDELFKKARQAGMKVNKVASPRKKDINFIRAEKKIECAHAPYNFVPLNKIIVQAKYPMDDGAAFDKYNTKDKSTGYIQCDLKTLTPLYIRNSDKNNSKFFSPADKIRIPGSSLRGMIRTLVEIASWSKFIFFDDKNLYYRALADVSSLRDKYKQKMTSPGERGRSNYEAKAGYLIKRGLKYYIIPAQKDIQGKPYKQIKRQQAQKICRGLNVPYRNFSFYQLKDGYLVISGSMPNKRRDWLIYHKDLKAEQINVCEDDVKSYRFDKGRTDKIDLLEKLSVCREVPCFYTTWTGKSANGKPCIRVAFGHTGMFRVAYEKSIGELIPEGIREKKNDDTIDIAEAIFGKTSFAGRVFFEDALPKDGYEKVDEKVIRQLGPKPTSFQLYLKQPENPTVKELNHYDSKGAQIRGNKFYWHSKKNLSNNKDYNPRTDTKIVPVQGEFSFRIRFENLSGIELGALLFVLNLPNGCAHKLGMGKALGLGSVKIKPTLFISDRKQRYAKLFNKTDSGNQLKWHTAESKVDLNEYIKAFQDKILNKLSPDEKDRASNLWQVPRLKALAAMLNSDENTKISGWKEKTSYMQLKEFRKRHVLPTPEKVTES